MTLLANLQIYNFISKKQKKKKTIAKLLLFS